MIESFVDLSYRGLPLGRRIKLSQVRPRTGYLEVPTPMPVGTEIAIVTDEGITLDATVTRIYEQVGGSDRTPGMLIEPKLAAPSSASWWSARVALPDEDSPEPPRGRPVTLRPRSKTQESPPPVEPAAPEPAAPIAIGRASTILGTGPQTITVTADEPPASERASRVDSTGLLHTLAMNGGGEPVGEAQLEAARTASGEIVSPEHGGRTTVMPAVDQELLASLTQHPEELAHLTSTTTGEYAVEDDGKQTTMMDAVDPAALGLEMTPSGRYKTVSIDDASMRDSGAMAIPTEGDDDGGDSSDSKPVASGVKKRRKKR